jgi:uncharacterized protein YwqG
MADRDEVLSKLAPLRRRAYLPVTEEGDGVATDGKLGGTPYLTDAASWPACGNCGEPMGLVLQLNPAQLPEPLRKQWGGDLIQLFYCGSNDPNCGADAEGWEPFSKPGLGRQVAIAGDPVTPARRPAVEYGPLVIRGWTAADDYPGWEEQEEVGVELDDDEADLAHELTLDGDKLSGWPNWIQSMEYPDCTECGKRMKLVFQIDSGGHLDINLGDMGIGHLTQCPTHKNVLGFGWAWLTPTQVTTHEA